MNDRGMNNRGHSRRVRTAVQLTMLAIGLVAFVYLNSPKSSNAAESVPAIAASDPNPPQDFSKFSHGTTQHSRMPCLLCHQRNDNSTRPKLPGHTPCAACHTQQFNDASSGICTICHTNAGSGALKGFPGLRSFSTKFDHSRHARLANCATCHSSSRQGVAFSVPARLGGHSTCFQCHGPDREVAGKNLGSCNTCHTPGRPVRFSATAKAFSKGFSHARHRGMSCSACHTVRAELVRSSQVSSPVAAMHFSSQGTASCASCHNNRRAFGANDFGDCKRCHQGSRFRF